MLASERDAVRRIVREELDILLNEIGNAAQFLDMGPAADVPVTVLTRVVRQVQTVRPGAAGDTREEGTDSAD